MQDFLDQITKHKRIGVFSHLRPDGDAIGSQVAVCQLLETYGLEVFAFNEDSSPKNLTWLNAHFPIEKPSPHKMGKCDAFLFVDGNALHRFGENAKQLSGRNIPLYMIDHHPEPDTIFKNSVHIVSATSASEIVYRLYKVAGMDRLSQGGAKALYTGIVTDTGSFRFDSVGPETHEAVADILRVGEFKPVEIHETLYDSKSMNQIQLMGLVLQTLEIFDGKIATIHITEKMMDETNTTKEDLEGLIQFPLSINGVLAAVSFVEMNKRIKLSFRTKRILDANLWANQYEGGGHVRASGGWFDGTIDGAKNSVVSSGKYLLAMAQKK